MKKQIHYLILLTATFFLLACGGGSHSHQNSNDFGITEKEFLHHLFLTEYLWFDQVPSNVDYAKYTSRQAMIDDLKFSQLDRWSFVLTAQEYNQMTEDKTEGFGFGFTPEFKVFLVRIDSPAYGVLQRGDTILEVNGEPVSADAIIQAKKRLGKPSTFTVSRNGETIQLSLTPRQYHYKVTSGKILNAGSKKVGYLRYDSFSSSSVSEFENEFTKFKQANVNELIVDLRYNGGGSVAVASALLDNISSQFHGRRQAYLDWNENMKNKNENINFSDEIEPNDLTMRRVVFLVSQNSASASEMVISALKPYLGDRNVITIGDRTHGKGVGMEGRVSGENFYFLINFYVRNDRGEAVGLEGIAPTCAVGDPVSRPMGDPAEPLLATALFYVAHNRCP